MIAIGITWAGLAVVDPLSLRHSGDFGIVLAADRNAATPRDRLGLQARATMCLPSFVPFSANQAFSYDDAAEWAAQNAVLLTEALVRLAGACQMVLDLRQIDEAPELPREWLRHRAARVTVPKLVAADLAPLTKASRLHLTPRGATVNFLIDQSDQPRFGSALQSFCAHRGYSGWSALLSGPWPPVAFYGTGHP